MKTRPGADMLGATADPLATVRTIRGERGERDQQQGSLLPAGNAGTGEGDGRPEPRGAEPAVPSEQAGTGSEDQAAGEAGQREGLTPAQDAAPESPSADDAATDLLGDPLPTAEDTPSGVPLATDFRTDADIAAIWDGMDQAARRRWADAAYAEQHGAKPLTDDYIARPWAGMAAGPQIVLQTQLDEEDSAARSRPSRQRAAGLTKPDGWTDYQQMEAHKEPLTQALANELRRVMDAKAAARAKGRRSSATMNRTALATRYGLSGDGMAPLDMLMGSLTLSALNRPRDFDSHTRQVVDAFLAGEGSSETDADADAAVLEGDGAPLPEADTAPAAQTEAGPAAESAASRRSADRIEDFGEKIGGARKDTAESTGPRGTRAKLEDARPAWMRRYSVHEITGSYRPENNGRFGIADSRSRRPPTRETFPTREAVEAAIPLLEVSRNHRITTDGDGFAIVRDVTDRKRVVIRTDFPNREAAQLYMAQNAAEIIETVTRIDDRIHPALEEAVREGETRREGDADVGPQDFADVFGFRGVEFGNWNNSAERQHILNQSYDAMLDLAEIMGVPPKAVSLNGELALAFGARGHGLQGARAHYERDRGVINLTKIRGAGSLAHEWMHAFDHYLARLAGKAPRGIQTKEDGGTGFIATDREGDYVSHGFGYKATDVRPELQEAFKGVMDAIIKRKAEYTEDTSTREKYAERAQADVSRTIAAVRTNLAQEQRYGAKKAAATAEQLTAFDAAADEILDREAGALVERNGYAMSEQVWALSDLMKQIRGRQGFSRTQGRINGPIWDIQMAVNNRAKQDDFIRDAQEQRKKERTVRTEYASQAYLIDRGSTTDYWSTPHELLARAFEAFVYDGLKDVEARNDFLAYEKHNQRPEYVMFKVKPFPEGQERADINHAFQHLFDTIEARETDQGVELFQRDMDGGAGYLVAAPDGSFDFGEISPEMAQAIGRQPGRIRLRRGDAKSGLAHITIQHGEEIRQRGYPSVEHFVAKIAGSFRAIYRREGRALDLVLDDADRGMLIVQLEPATRGDFYDVRTATIIRPGQYNRKVPLWEMAGPSVSPEQRSDPLDPKGQSQGSIPSERLVGNGDMDGGEPVAVLRGDELGAWSDIRQLGRKAEAWYRDNLIGRTVIMESTGWPVRFGRVGSKKLGGRKGDVLLRAVPALEQIIRGAAPISTAPGAKPGTERQTYHKVGARIGIDGTVYDIVATLREDANGVFHYDLSMEQSAEAENPGATDRVAEARSGPPDSLGILNLDFASESVKPSPAIAPHVARRVVAAARERLAALGITGVEVRVEQAPRPGVKGSYGGGIMRLFRTDRGWRHTADHEVIHILRERGAITADEWKALVRAARADKALMAKAADTYRDLPPIGQMEEAVAEMFADWRRRQSLPGQVRAAFERIAAVFRALRDAMHGVAAEPGIAPEVAADLRAGAEIMERIADGTVGRRGPDGGGKPRDAQGRFVAAEQRQPLAMDPVTIGGTLASLSSHPDYHAAKGGDVEAAVRLAKDVVTDDLMQRVREAIGGRRPVIVPVISEEASGRNKIPLAAAEVMATRLGVETEMGIVQSNTPRRTSLSGLDRIFASPTFDGGVIPGQDYLLLDDTLTQGGTFAALAGHIEVRGGRVVGAVALTGKQYSARLIPSAETLTALRDKHGDSEGDFRAATGHGFDSLTESEARYLTNFEPASAVRDRILEERRRRGEGPDQGTPSAVVKEQRDLSAALGAAAARAKGWTTRDHWKRAPGFFSSLLTDAMGRHDAMNTLALVPGRPLFTELGKGLAAAQDYLRLKMEMDSLRDARHAEADTLAQEWAAAGRKDRAANDDMMRLMHDSTLMQVDPSQEFASDLDPAQAAMADDPQASPEVRRMAARAIARDDARRESHADFKARFDALPQAFRDLYSKVRDSYRDLADAVDQALLDNIDTAAKIAARRAERAHAKELQRIRDEGLEGIERAEAIAEADNRLLNAQTRGRNAAAARRAKMRAAFEANRLQGPYFPLARFGNYFVTVRGAEGQAIGFSRFEKKADQDRYWAA